MKKAVLIFFGAMALMAACKQGKKPDTATTTPAENKPKPVEVPLQILDDSGKVQQQAVISTPMGEIIVKLYNETPQHRDNFIKLVNGGFYKNLLFHRIIQGFMIQGGDPDSKDAKPGQALGGGEIGYTVPAEINPKFVHTKGKLAAARTPDQINPQRRSSASQFYIVHGEPTTAENLQNMAASKGFQYTQQQIDEYLANGGTPALDRDYTIFGEVVSGWDVIDKIAAQPKDGNDRPFSDIRFSVKMRQ